MRRVEQEDYLMHFGIKGQKWGVRRYQNADGSLTEAGRKHYGLNSKRMDRYEDKVRRKIKEDAEKKGISEKRSAMNFAYKRAKRTVGSVMGPTMLGVAGIVAGGTIGSNSIGNNSTGVAVGYGLMLGSTAATLAAQRGASYINIKKNLRVKNILNDYKVSDEDFNKYLKNKEYKRKNMKQFQNKPDKSETNKTNLKDSTEDSSIKKAVPKDNKKAEPKNTKKESGDTKLVDKKTMNKDFNKNTESFSSTNALKAAVSKSGSNDFYVSDFKNGKFYGYMNGKPFMATGEAAQTLKRMMAEYG